MKDYQERVVAEKKELDDKRVKLTAFLKTKTFEALDIAEKARLASQSNIMLQYSNVLSERIAAFK
jgi:hypothetical protein